MRTINRARLAIGRDATLGTVMDQLAAIHGTRRLVEESQGGLRVSYEQAARRVRRWSGGIATRIEPGDRVVIHTPNDYLMMLLCLAVSRAGGVAVPVNAQMRPDEIAHVIDDCAAALVIRSVNQIDGGNPQQPAAEADPDDVAALFYTSGTTGSPKGVELTHRSLLGQALPGVLWPSRLHRDLAVVSLPVAHIMGFASLIGLACAGIPVWFLPSFRAEAVLDAIEARRATIFIGVPAMFRMLLEAGAAERDLRSVRVWMSGADVMPPELAKRFKQMGATVTLPGGVNLGEAAFVEGYGMVELGGGAAAKISPPFLSLGLGEALGFPLPSWKMRVVDDEGNEVRAGEVGELLITGPGLTKGYWNAPDATSVTLTDDGWLHTGDLARRGPLGVILFAGRSKDVIVSGGYTVYAVEVEQALCAHPAVLEAAVVGLEDERLGEVPAAALRVDPAAKVDIGELLEWAEDHLAHYKVPRQVVLVEDLPRTGTEKVQKRELRQLFAS